MFAVAAGHDGDAAVSPQPSAPEPLSSWDVAVSVVFWRCAGDAFGVALCAVLRRVSVVSGVSGVSSVAPVLCLYAAPVRAFWRFAHHGNVCPEPRGKARAAGPRHDRCSLPPIVRRIRSVCSARC
eukprot:684511-Rhodomonas_salina.8